MLALNEGARAEAEPLVRFPERYNVAVSRAGNGTLLIDCGVHVTGGLQAGLVFARVALGGLADVTLSATGYGRMVLPSISVCVDRPIEALMASQYAGWAIKVDDYFAMGSGPARALSGGEDIFAEIGHKEKSDCATLCLETAHPPTEPAIEYILRKTGVEPAELTILFAPTASIAGSVQISARIVETAVHKMRELGFGLDSIKSGCGQAPVAPVAHDDISAIGRTNDCVLYGGSAFITVDCDDSLMREKIDLIPSSSSADYGKTFIELYKKYGDFYKIDPLIFAPAMITLNNIRSGLTLSSGALNEGMLEKSMTG